MIKYTILSIIYAFLLLNIGTSGMSITTKFVLFAIIDFIFAKITHFVKNPFKKEELEEDLSFAFLIFSIVLQVTYGAFLISQHSNKNVKIFGIVLLIICLCAIVYFIINIISIIKDIIIEFKKYKIEIKEAKFRDRIKFKLGKIDEIDDKIIFLQNEIEKLSEKDEYKIRFLYASIVEYSLDKIDEIGNKITFLQKELEKLSEEDESKKGYLEFKIKKLSEEKAVEEERIAREKAEEEERSRIWDEVVDRLENKNFLETDLDRIFEKDEGCLLVLYNVVWNELGNKGELIKPRECEELYITNKRLFVRTVREMKAIVHFSQIIDMKAYTDGIEIHKPGPYFFIGINDEADVYKANICIKKSKEYL